MIFKVVKSDCPILSGGGAFKIIKRFFRPNLGTQKMVQEFRPRTGQKHDLDEQKSITENCVGVGISYVKYLDLDRRGLWILCMALL